MDGRPIIGLDGKQVLTPLADCFRVFVPEDMDMAWPHRPTAANNGADGTQPQSYLEHSFKLISVTSAGAARTGKTTCAWGLAHALALGGLRVLLLNAASQPSAEECCLAKLVNTHFGGLSQFFSANGLGPAAANAATGANPREEHHAPTHEPQTLLAGLQALQHYQQQEAGPQDQQCIPRRVVAVDVQRLASQDQGGPGGSGRLFVMRSAEDISEWEAELSSSVHAYRSDLNAPEVFSRPPGAFYHLAQMQAYVLDASYVIVDTGRGSGPLLMNIIMSSHGFLVPCAIEHRGFLDPSRPYHHAESVLATLADQIMDWNDEDNPGSHVRICADVNSVREAVPGVATCTRYPAPTHTPKFLGVVYSPLGLCYRQFPYNQYTGIRAANAMLQDLLLPCLRAYGMLLPDEIYALAADRVPTALDDFNSGPQAIAQMHVPGPQPGVLGVLLEYGAMQHVSERESVPVFDLRPQHHLQHMQHMQRECDRMAAKVAHLHALVSGMVAMVQLEYDQPEWPRLGAVPQPGPREGWTPGATLVAEEYLRSALVH
ncbi:hypothetical protein TSOC_007357 [Tetrabaena socialis]|uniref:CobQ/CobB/MinD/ParA nucleotide binding domain-containing protein n=1 Tax=Tetrabaena socialis TaxID=47790 RepID=A0A2J8A196_9CHLO|nr:hypothetical protein TSOC_007357 [Tetrabaena socialis]|eukprot:PNH06290.1 hypothetical protein TSOC_007357 [Tetrabaena socialis]